MGSQCLILILCNLYSESVMGRNFWDPTEDCDTGSPSSVTVRMEYLLFFNSDIVNFVWKTDDEETESIVLFIFFLWLCFNRWWMSGDGVGQKVFFRAS